MIERLSVNGLKRFSSHAFDFAPLTLLTGLNGSGKTSLIHAVLLAREATVVPLGGSLRLNEPFGLELGTAADVRNWDADNNITIAMSWDKGAHEGRWSFEIPSHEDLFLRIASRPDDVPMALGGSPRAFTYLCAERLGPRSVLGASPLPDDQLEVGPRGEFCAQVLAANGNKTLQIEGREHPSGSDSLLLKYQVERWLSEIARPVQLDAIRYPNTAVTALRFRSPKGEWVRAPNMGFGVSYALPIVLAGLMMPKGALLIVENPEAHLHPGGQSRIGQFLAWLVGQGVQVMVETHSDHVLNGIRRAIGELGYLTAADAIVQYFNVTPGEEADIHALRFTERGGLSNWPAGFFDQYQIDVAALGRLRRGR